MERLLHAYVMSKKSDYPAICTIWPENLLFEHIRFIPKASSGAK